MDNLRKQAKGRRRFQFRQLIRYLANEELIKEVYQELPSSSRKRFAPIRVTQLSRNVYSSKYRPRPPKPKLIPKADGTMRKIFVPIIPDLILQKSAALILDSIFDDSFVDWSHAYRRDKGPKKALINLWNQLLSGRYKAILLIDIEGCFDNIDHGHLFGFLETRIKDQKFLQMLRIWCETRSQAVDQFGIGIPQGLPISPVLMNLYLHNALDSYLDGISLVLGGPNPPQFIRYADDIIGLFCDDASLSSFLPLLKERLSIFNLKPNAKKTRIHVVSSPLNDEVAFDFLGLRHELTGNPPSWKRRTSTANLIRLQRRSREIAMDASLPVDKKLKILNSMEQNHIHYFDHAGNNCIDLARQIVEHARSLCTGP
jgi:retron-type reverse transcriptase